MEQIGTVGQFGVHGVQTQRDWPSLTVAEVQSVLANYPTLPQAITPVWHSMRPFSAAVRVNAEGGRSFLIKRHHAALRSVAALHEEHAFMRHLAQQAAPVCLPFQTLAGATAWAKDNWTYEVFPLAPGQDSYRDDMSWQPYHSPAQAAAAGAVLAQLHSAARSYTAPPRGSSSAQGGCVESHTGRGTIQAGRPLTSSMHAITQPELLPALAEWAEQQHGLAAQLACRPWQTDIMQALGPHHARLVPFLKTLLPSWGHGDWHGSNLFWTTQAPPGIACVLDFGMAEQTCALFDLAVALERSMIDWLALETGRTIHYVHMAAFLQAYGTKQPLSVQDRAILAAFLPLVHVEFALSEVAYFATMVQDAASAEVAYTDYLLGHGFWFSSQAGQNLLHWIRCGDFEKLCPETP